MRMSQQGHSGRCMQRSLQVGKLRTGAVTSRAAEERGGGVKETVHISGWSGVGSPDSDGCAIRQGDTVGRETVPWGNGEWSLGC